MNRRSVLVLGGALTAAGAGAWAVNASTREAPSVGEGAGPGASGQSVAFDKASPTPSASPRDSSGAGSRGRGSSKTSPAMEEQAIVAEFQGRSPVYWGEHAEGTVATFTPPRGSKDIALTFDACGGSLLQYDSELIETLRRTHTKATLFINRNWAKANPALFSELADDPLFEIGNHGDRHVPLSVSGKSAWGIRGTASVSEIWQEIRRNSDFMEERGVFTRFMRPGTAYTDEIAAQIARRLEQPVATFSVNADGGARFPAWMVAMNVASAKPGDIVIGHFNQPGSGTAAGVKEGIARLRDKGVTFVTLSEGLGSTSPSSS